MTLKKVERQGYTKPLAIPTLIWSLHAVQGQVFWLVLIAVSPSRQSSGLIETPFSRHLQLQIQLRIYTGFLIKFDKRTPKNGAKVHK